LRQPQTDETRVHDPLSAGRRLASRAIAWQAGATALTALAFYSLGAPSALAAAVGGGAAVAGNLAAARMALGGGVQPAGSAIGRLLLGVIFKWVAVLTVLGLGMAVWRLPPLPMLVSLSAATLAFALANLLKR
jgi:F0F1-type ATP synthase assembly protein I